MGVDIATAIERYENASEREPMHGQQGQIRRNPSSDQKRVRREMTRKQAEVADTATIAELLSQASRPGVTLEQRQALMHKVEQLRTDRDLVRSAEAALDLTVKEAVQIVPHGTHELTTESTDWLVATASEVKGDATEAERALVAEASMWFERVPDFVKAEPEEFRVQANALGRRVASQYGDAADAAHAAFMREVDRLHRMAVKGGLAVTASQHTAAEVWHLGEDGSMERRDDLNFNPETSTPPSSPNPDQLPEVRHEPEAEKGTPLRAHDEHRHPLEVPGMAREIERHRSGADVAGVREMGEGYARHVVNGVSKAANLLRNEDEETASLGTVLAGFALAEEAGAAGAEGGEGSGLDKIPGIGGGGGNPINSLDQSANDTASSVRGASDAAVSNELNRAASSQVPQVGGTSGMPMNTFPTFAPQTSADQVTDSNRAPALQEIQNFTGWDGTSVVPAGDSGAAAANFDQSGTEDASANDGLAGQFPVGGTIASIHTASKESAMTEHAQCPTCGGHGKVAVRKQAYSGLPQIDQIVNADESPGTTPYPTEVAFPFTGWGQDPNQGQSNVQQKINETEAQIAQRNQKSPLMSASAAAGGAGLPSGPDNSGWLGTAPTQPAPGGKGQRYPGYSSPSGYDGSNNLGEPDPVYGYGGDNGNQPLKPYGAQEADDITNNPGQPYNPGVPHNNDQAYRQVAPQDSMSTMGSHHDPVIAAAQEEILRQQAAIRARMASQQRVASA